MKITLTSSKDTINLGTTIAKFLQAGDVIVLNGDLGAGKTTFTKGIASGLGISDVIKSPTFTIIREYQEGRLPLYHMDVYRLENGGGEELGLEEYFDSDGVSVVEWAQFVADELPTDYLAIKFERTKNDDTRVLTLEPHGEHFTKLVTKLDQNND